MREQMPITDPSAPVEIIRGYSIHVLWQPQRHEELLRFWLDNGAIHDIKEAQRRIKDVVCLAFDPLDRIAGVSSVYTDAFGPTAEKCWFYRTFVRPDCRVPGLAIRLLRVTLRQLAQLTANRVELPKSLVIITENRRLTHPRVRKMLAAEGMKWLSKNSDGMDVWKRDF